MKTLSINLVLIALSIVAEGVKPTRKNKDGVITLTYSGLDVEGKLRGQAKRALGKAHGETHSFALANVEDDEGVVTGMSVTITEEPTPNWKPAAEPKAKANTKASQVREIITNNPKADAEALCALVSKADILPEHMVARYVAGNMTAVRG